MCPVGRPWSVAHGRCWANVCRVRAPTRAPTTPSTTAVNTPIVGVPQIPDANHFRVLVTPQPSSWRERKRSWTWKKSLSSNSLFLYAQAVFLPSATLCASFPAATPSFEISFYKQHYSQNPLHILLLLLAACGDHFEVSRGPVHTTVSAQWPVGCLQLPQGLQPETWNPPRFVLLPIPCIQPTKHHLSGFYLL